MPTFRRPAGEHAEAASFIRGVPSIFWPAYQSAAQLRRELKEPGVLYVFAPKLDEYTILSIIIVVILIAITTSPEQLVNVWVYVIMLAGAAAAIALLILLALRRTGLT